MKTDSMQPKGIFIRLCGVRIVILALGALLALATHSKAASKNGGGTTTTQPIGVQFWLDDFWLDEVHGLTFPNVLIADGDTYAQPSLGLPATAVTPPYKDGLDYVSAKIGRDERIIVNLVSQFKKPAIRFYLVNPGFPAVNPVSSACAPSGVVYTDERPAVANQILGAGSSRQVSTGNSMLIIYGQDFDDMPPGVVRHVNARQNFADDNATVWAVYFGARIFPGGFQYAPCGSCMLVQRLPNTADGKSRWRFSTEAQVITNAAGETENLHVGYLYKGFSSPPVFAGIVNLSLSGTIESLSLEPEPSSEGYTVPDVPAECPLLVPGP
ncbi:MAG: hypothetical protein HYY23_21020 [Verrucomicrobia bacterium]|nr:hypothetical protein [Verrucomicrobiota bacterium]